MFIEFFQPSKKNLLALYLLQILPWTPKIFDNGEFCDALFARIASMLIVYLYSKKASAELQGCYIELLNILVRYFKTVVIGIICITISEVVPFAIVLVICFLFPYALYSIARYYVELFSGISTVWNMPYKKSD